MSRAPAAQPNRASWMRLVGTLLALVLLVYLFSRQGWEEIWNAMRQIPWPHLLIALGLTFVSRFAVATRWHLLLRAARLPVTLSDSVRLTFAGLFASNFLPTTIGGDVVRLAGAIQLKWDAAVSAASLVVDRLVGMAGMAMALPFGVPRFLEIFSPAGAGAALGTPLAVGWLGWLPQTWRERMLRTLKRLGAALAAWLGKPRSLLLSLACTWVHMLCLYGSIYVLLNGMQEKMSFWLIAGLWSAVYFFTLLPISINGYGLQEISITFTFTRVGGISEPAALTLALLLRTINLIASLPGAVFVPGIMAAERQAQISQEQS